MTFINKLYQMIINLFSQQQKEEPMFQTFVNLFKSNGWTEFAAFGQIMNAILSQFLTEKFTNGESGRDAAIDAIISELQAHKSTAPKA